MNKSQTFILAVVALFATLMSVSCTKEAIKPVMPIKTDIYQNLVRIWEMHFAPMARCRRAICVTKWLHFAKRLRSGRVTNKNLSKPLRHRHICVAHLRLERHTLVSSMLTLLASSAMAANTDRNIRRSTLQPSPRQLHRWLILLVHRIE